MWIAVNGKSHNWVLEAHNKLSSIRSETFIGTSEDEISVQFSHAEYTQLLARQAFVLL